MDQMDMNQMQKAQQIQQAQWNTPIFTEREQELLAPEVHQERLYSQLKQSEDYQEQTENSRILYQEQMAIMQDTAKLGRKSIKGEKAIRTARNERIQRGRDLTSKATAYTEEIYNQLRELKEQEPQAEGAEETEKRLRRLELYRFSPQMFVSSHIRANFKEYMTLVQDYQYLQEHLKREEGTDAGRLNFRMWELEPVLALLTTRMQVYCEQNRVAMDGSILGDKKVAAKLSGEQMEQWYDRVSAQEEKKGMQYHTELDQLDAQMQMLQEKQKEQAVSMDRPEELTMAQRIQAVDQLAAEYTRITELRQAVEADTQTDPAELASLKEEEQRFRAYYLLAAREADYVSRKAAGEDDTELAEKNQALYEDIQRLEHRRVREEIGMRISGERGVQESRRSRMEAITTHSDQKSYRSRERLAELERELERAGGSTQVQHAVRQYIQGNRYRVGYTEERNRLQAAIKEVKQALENVPEDHLEEQTALESIKQYFDHMTNGTLVIPEGAQIRDFSGQRPEETGRVERGGTRTAALRSVTYWSNQKSTPLFAHEPTINDLKQRLVSNCYMMASTAGLVEYSPELLKSCIVDEGETVVVRLYEWQKVEQQETPQSSGQETQTASNELEQIEELDDIEEFEVERRELRPIYVRVNKEIPRIAGADALSSGALWMQMIEKACAFVGRDRATGYQSLWYGEGGQFLERLVGVSSEPVDTADPDAFFQELLDARKQGYVYNAGSDGDAGSADGLNGGHAYTVMGAKEINGKKYVLMRNPYSTFSLQYEENGEKTRTGSGIHVSSDDTYGQFYMELSDFVGKFHRVSRTNLGRVI